MARRIWTLVLLAILAALVLLPEEGGTVTVCCPGGAARTTYYYDLVGENFLEPIVVDYVPGDASSVHATIDEVPLGTYRLLENGVERARLRLTADNANILIQPEADWPIMPPK